MNLARVQSLIAPLATPAAPALLLANEVRTVMLLAGFAKDVALIGSGLSMAGMECAGALMCYNAIRAWQKRSLRVMWLSIGGAIAYTTIIITGINQMEVERGRIFGWFSLLTLLAYFAYAVFEADRNQGKEAATVATIAIDQTAAETARIEAERKLVNSQTRQIKAGVQPAKTVNFTNFTPTLQADTITAKGQTVIDYLNNNGDAASLRDIAEATNCSHQTVKTWLKYWRENK